MILFRLPIAFLRLLIRSVLLALSQIWANKGRSILTTIGIVIGVAAVTAVIAALTGLKTNVLKDFESFGANTMWVLPHRPDSGPHRYASWRSIRFQPEDFDGLLDHCPSVNKFTRIAGSGGSTVRYEDRTADVNVQAIEPPWHQIENRFVTLGRPFSLIDDSAARNVCLITAKLRDKLRMDRDCIGQRISINNRSYVAVGMIEAPVEHSILGGRQLGDEVFIPFRSYWKLYRNAGFFYVMASSKSPALSTEAQAEIRFFMRRRRDLKPGEPDTFRVEAVQKYIDQFNKISTMVTLIAGGIVGISLLVGGVGIMNIMLVSVSERTREVGLRKAVGARPSAILLQFLVEAMTLCLIGGLIGVMVGQMLTSIMAAFPAAKLENSYIPLWAIEMSFGFAFCVGVIFGMFPAIKAARLDPIEALRHE